MMITLNFQRDSIELSLMIFMLALSNVVSLGKIKNDSNEYCEWEIFNATCMKNEIIIMQYAKYGRMKSGRCITNHYTDMVCVTDVTLELDNLCSGHQNCIFHVISLHQKRSCPKDFKSYLEASFDCLPVNVPENEYNCTHEHYPKLSSPNGLLSSSVALKTGIGLESCPLLIQVESHQRINITLIDFSVSPDDIKWFSGLIIIDFCKRYAVITEMSGSPLTTFVCGQLRRETMIYLTRSNSIKISINSSTALDVAFVLKYQAFGCIPLTAPTDAWIGQSSEQMATIYCNKTDEAWHVTCIGTSWHGFVGNCSVPHLRNDDWLFGNIFSGVSLYSHNVFIVVGIGIAIGISVGALLLLFTILYVRRQQRQLKIHNRSRYNFGKTMKFDQVTKVLDTTSHSEQPAVVICSSVRMIGDDRKCGFDWQNRQLPSHPYSPVCNVVSNKKSISASLSPDQFPLVSLPLNQNSFKASRNSQTSTRLSKLTSQEHCKSDDSQCFLSPSTTYIKNETENCDLFESNSRFYFKLDPEITLREQMHVSSESCTMCLAALESENIIGQKNTLSETGS